MALPYLGQDKGEEDGEAGHQQVPRGVEVNKLEVGEADGRDDAEHDAEDAPNDGGGDGEEEGPHLAHHSKQDENHGRVLYDPPAAHLEAVKLHFSKFQGKSVDIFWRIFNVISQSCI